MGSIGLHFILLVTHYYFDVELVPLYDRHMHGIASYLMGYPGLSTTRVIGSTELLVSSLSGRAS